MNLNDLFIQQLHRKSLSAPVIRVFVSL